MYVLEEICIFYTKKNKNIFVELLIITFGPTTKSYIYIYIYIHNFLQIYLSIAIHIYLSIYHLSIPIYNQGEIIHI